MAYVARLGRRGLEVRPTGEVAEALHKLHRLSTGRSLALTAVSIIAIIAASEMLVSGAAGLLDRLGLSQTVVGMSVLALAISVEELARELRPALQGRPEVAFGNVAGSVLAFFLFNAGVIALISPFSVDLATQRFYLPVAAVTVVLIAVLLMNGKLTRWGGGLLLAAYLVFAIGGYLVFGPAVDHVAG